MKKKKIGERTFTKKLQRKILEIGAFKIVIEKYWKGYF